MNIEHCPPFCFVEVAKRAKNLSDEVWDEKESQIVQKFSVISVGRPLFVPGITITQLHECDTEKKKKSLLSANIENWVLATYNNHKG